jgi:hypothetical protein
VCVQILQKIAADGKIKHAESCLTSHNVPNTPPGHNRPTVLQEAHEFEFCSGAKSLTQKAEAKDRKQL